MSRLLGFLAALLVMLFMAGPAAAGVHHYTDSRGIIHISNGPPPQTKATRGDGPAVAPELQAASPVPEPEPSAHPLAQLPPSARPEALPLPKNSGTTPPLAALCDSWQLPLQEAAGKITAAFQASSKPMRAFSPPRPVVVTAGGINRYRDAAGIWHITNQAPATAGSAPAIMQAEKRHSPGETAPAARPVRPESLASRLPWRPVSYSPDIPEFASLRTTLPPARVAALEGDKPIRRYRDRHGVIHISNVEPDAAPPLPERRRLPVQARLETRKGRPPPGQDHSLEAWTAAAFRPASWSGENVFQLAKRVKGAVPPKEALTTEGGIRRWRDKKGVWHIKSVEYPWPAGVPVPPRLAGLIPGTRRAEAPLTMAPPGGAALLRAPPQASQAPPAAYRGSLTTVTAFRDRQGRLRITNARPWASPGRAPPPGLTIAPADLEPLIVEAAQVYRLPPSLVKAVIKEESDFCAWAVSPKGAMGLMQLMPGTADFLGVREPFNPRENILGGCRYLRLLLDYFGGSVPLALAGYNAGYHRVVANGFQVPPIKETQNFVTRVMERYFATENQMALPWT